MQVLRGRNAVLLIEDVHWADEDSAALIERMLRTLDPGCPFLIVTQRPEGPIGPHAIPGLRTIALDRLPTEEAVQILASLGQDEAEKIVAKAGGVPLFLEEIARLDASPTGSGSPLPDTLSGLLQQRIDAVPAHFRSLIEAAAVLGAEPSDDLLLPLSGLRPEAYEGAIAHLSDGDLLFRIRSVPQRAYAFKHALLQEAAYQSIPAHRRRALHARVLELNEERWRAGDKDLSAMLARHALSSDQPAAAVELALCATQTAVARSSYPLADAMLSLALDAVRKMPASPVSMRTEAQILKWRRPMSWLLSKADIEAGLERSEKLALELRDDHLLADVCVHRAYLHSDDGQLRKALRYCERAEESAVRAGAEHLRVEASLARCQTRSLHGHMRQALGAAEPCLSAWDDRRTERGEFIVTRFVMLRFLLARSRAALGLTDGARSCLRECAEAARGTARPVDRYIALRGLAEALRFSGEDALSHEVFEASLGVADAAQLTSYVTWSEADILEIEIRADEHSSSDRLRRLLQIAEDSLYPIAGVKAKAALALACDDLTDLSSVLDESRRLDLPLVQLDLLGRIAGRAGPGAAAARAEIDRIRAEQGYAPAAVGEDDARALLALLA